MIPRPNSNANRTIKFKVTDVPIIPSATGKNRKATKTLNGTLNATKNALVTPIKNIRMINTSTKPIIIVLTSSLNDFLVSLPWSPVITTFRSLGKSSFSCISATMAIILSAALIRFSPARFTIFKVITFLPSSLAKLSLSFTVSFSSAMSFK